jgi:arylsulfatase
MIELIDENVGRMMAALENSGQRENIVVIFTSDHGEMLGDHGLGGKGCRFYEGAVRVPFIISLPGRFEQGVVAEGLTGLTDLAPTIAELTELPRVKSHGHSLVPILTGTSDPESNHRYVRCEYYDTLDMQAPNGTGDRRETWGTMYRDERWKLIVHHSLGIGELYDLDNDPDEFENLWDAESTKSIRQNICLESFNASIQRVDSGPPLIGRY